MHRPLTIARRKTRTLAVGLAASMMVLGNVASVGAAALNTASVELGDPRSGETTTYTVSASGFTTATTIQCVQVALNDAADGGGSVPNAIDTTSSTLDSNTLGLSGTWVVDNTTNGVLEINDATGDTPNASGNIVWGSVLNGDTDGTTYYALLTTYTDQACTGGNEVDNVTMAFIYKDGELVQLTIEPTLSFTCVAVGSGEDIEVGGDTTTVASGASGIDHTNTVTAVQNGISAHDLQVTTNASGGYDVYIRHTAQLTNAASDTIDNHSGTNATPTSFPAAGTEAWGYTTADPDLAQFDPGDYAGFTTSNEQVVTNSAATAGAETTRVGHQVGISNTTEAGTYLTTIVYTIVATY